ncbi:hypothetical protein I316_01273 [Kwoniella heveanensis BCC8398]|uniref:Spindle pole body component n=1 Tax=Kwoniella heveanensis BCC8398 TaxID=1296120 RepID=A0A1B9H0A5_9TREE|nr:hypothetical protein I316_01273 [Kwoniella heveanensis BCC8398]
MTTTILFQLEPLALDSANSPSRVEDATTQIKSLSELDQSTAPRFFLPQMDEHISGNERLLASLRGSSNYSLQDLPALEPRAPLLSELSRVSDPGGIPIPTTMKGKGREVAGDDETADIWARASEVTEDPGPSKRIFQPIKTWDIVDSSRPRSHKTTLFLSEKPVFCFEALLTANDPSIQLPNLRSRTSMPPVQDPEPLLQLMMRATLGTMTTEYLKWDKRKARYVWGTEGGRPTGLEGVTAISAFKTFLDVGTAIRRLETIIDDQTVLPLTPTHHALFHAVATYVNFIKQRLTSAVEDCIGEGKASWNRWIGVTKDLRELTEGLCDVMGWPLSGSTALSLPSKASSLLSHLYAHLLASSSTSTTSTHATSPATLAFAYLLSSSSEPFFTLLHSWIGLGDSTIQDDDPDITSQPWADLGITRRTLSTSEGGWEYTFSTKRMPVFIPLGEARSVFEAGRSLRLLRAASAGGHPLCATDWGIEARWTWGEEGSLAIKPHVRRANHEIAQWRRSTRDRTRPLSGSTSFGKLRVSIGHRKERKRIPMDLFHQSAEVNSPMTEKATYGTDTTSPEAELERLFALLDKVPGSHLDFAPSQAEIQKSHLWALTPLETLHAFIDRFSRQSILSPDSPTLPLFISQHLLSPLLAHCTLISTSLVSLFLDDLRFLDHLDILQSFWLGGDVNFVERVSSALFGGKEAEAGAGEALGLGRRARTRARLGLGQDSGNAAQGGKVDLPDGEWGIGLGLGLSERTKWPPGGSELAYALRTTLLDDRLQEQVASRGPVWEEVEDRVSFAIRQLPEDDASGRRAKWMDPQGASSRRALDFLYLSYSPPPSITVLLPRPLLAKYQSINNLLLRLARCEVVLRAMYWPILHHTDLSIAAGDDSSRRKIDIDSRLDRASAKASETLQRSRDREWLALFPEYSTSEKRVRVLRLRMAHFVTALGRYVVDTAIGIKWGTMRRRLERLRKKAQDPVREEHSRPASPSAESQADDDEHLDSRSLDHDYAEVEDDSNVDSDGDEEDNVGGRGTGVGQLQSIHSLVLYHNLTLDKILQACLLGSSAGQQVTSKIMMRLLGLVLDLGKVLVEVERGAKGWQEGAEIVQDLEREWNEKERVFLHALERLSLRTSSKKPQHEDREQQDLAAGDRGGGEGGNDLKMLIAGEDDNDTAFTTATVKGRRRGLEKEGNDLQELLLRLSLERRTGGGASGVGGVGVKAGDNHRPPRNGKKV